MASTSELSSLSVRLLLLALLWLTPTGAGADLVTWRECKQLGPWARVLESLPGNDATVLDLVGCHITEIKRGDFDGLPNIENIWISYNDIAHVDPVAFRSVQKLKTLSLWHNELRELPVFDEPSLFPNLTGLDLSENQLTVIQHARTFSACTQLQQLRLNNNNIEHLHHDVFKPLTELTRLYLFNNKITSISESLFVNNNKLIELRLEYNRFSHLPSNLVTELSNAGAGLSEFYFDHNPWHCACLLELLADVKRVGVKDYNYFGAGYDGTRPVCVYSGAYSCYRHASPALLRAPPRAPVSSCNSP